MNCEHCHQVKVDCERNGCGQRRPVDPQMRQLIPTLRASYRGTTARGRTVVEPSLQECATSLALTLGIDPLAVVTVQNAHVADVWYLYASQTAVDTDVRRGPITSDSPGWVALIAMEIR